MICRHVGGSGEYVDKKVRFVMRLIALVVTAVICYGMVDQGGWAYLIIAVPLFIAMMFLMQLMGLAK